VLYPKSGNMQWLDIHIWSKHIIPQLLDLVCWNVIT